MASSIRLIATVALIASLAVPAFAQVNPSGPTVGPAGGVATTTAPSNGEGTPAGGTGVVSTTRVGPSGVAPAMPMASAPMAAPARPRRVYHRRRRVYHRPATETGTQSQDGTNGSVAPAAK